MDFESRYIFAHKMLIIRENTIDKVHRLDTKELQIALFQFAAILTTVFSRCCYLSRLMTIFVPLPFSSVFPWEHLPHRGINSISHLFVSLAFLFSKCVDN